MLSGGIPVLSSQQLAERQAFVSTSQSQRDNRQQHRSTCSAKLQGKEYAARNVAASHHRAFTGCQRSASLKAFPIARQHICSPPSAFLKQWFGRGASEEAGIPSPDPANVLQRPPASSQPQTAPPAPLLSGSGGGIFFFHQLGAVKYVAERYDLTDPRVACFGASAGALLAVLAACGVSADDALASAHKLALEHGIFERPLGVAGIWGSLIRNWLDELLPANALEMCRDRVKMVVTEVPSLRQLYLDEFESRDDLIDAAMASAHIPFLLDWRLTASASGRRFVDGSLKDFLDWRNSPLLTCNGAAFVIDYSQDEMLKYERLDFVKLKGYEEVKELMDLGYQYAARQDAEGKLERHFGIVARQPKREASAASDLGRMHPPAAAAAGVLIGTPLALSAALATAAAAGCTVLTA